MAAKPLTLSNGKGWPTRGKAKEHFREMLHRYGPGSKVTVEEDAEDLRALLTHYDEGWEPKKASKPIAEFSVDWNGAEGRMTPSFYIHYQDGTKDDFSFVKAVAHDPSRNRT